MREQHIFRLVFSFPGEVHQVIEAREIRIAGDDCCDLIGLYTGEFVAGCDELLLQPLPLHTNGTAEVGLALLRLSHAARKTSTGTSNRETYTGLVGEEADTLRRF